MPFSLRAFPAIVCLVSGLCWGIFAPSIAVGNFEDVIQESQTELAIDEALRDASPGIIAALQDAATLVAESRADSATRVAAADWYLSVLGKLSQAIDQPDPEDALRDTWILMRQVEASLQSDQAINTFGDSRMVLLRGAEDARSRIVGFARFHLSRDQFNRIRNMTIQEERRLHSLDPGHQGFFNYGSLAQTEEARTYLGSFLSSSEEAIHMVPGSELAEGALRQTFDLIGSAARLSRRGVGGVAGGLGTATGLSGVEHMSITLRQLPTDLRVNTEQILDNENYRAALQSLDGVSESAGRVAEAVERLAEETRESIDRIDGMQPGLQETIREADVAIRSVETVLMQAERASLALESTMRAASETAEIAERIVGRPPEGREPREGSEPFRVESVTEAAEALEATIAELHAALLALHDLLKEPQIPALASTAASESKGVVDHVIFRLWLLLAGCLVLLLLYHVARHMLAAQWRRDDPGHGTATARE